MKTTEKISFAIYESIEKTREDFKKRTVKIAEDIQNELMLNIDCYLAENIQYLYEQNVKNEVRKVVTALLLGNDETIKKFNLDSKYTFDRLHEIRMKIWETCSTSIEGSIIEEQQNTIHLLRKKIKILNEYRY